MNHDEVLQHAVEAARIRACDVDAQLDPKEAALAVVEAYRAAQQALKAIASESAAAGS